MKMILVVILFGLICWGLIVIYAVLMMVADHIECPRATMATLFYLSLVTTCLSAFVTNNRDL
jgi:hypothetical protein